MRLYIIVIYFTFTCSLVNTEELYRRNNNNNNTLYLAHVVFRHGERTPQRSYPKDIYKNESYYPYGYGQLTNKGKLRMYNLGLSLRERYANFLGDIYNPKQIKAQSSALPRARMSCDLVMAGLFQPHSVEKWHPELNWQPTICDYSQPEEDFILLPEKSCKKGKEIAKDAITKDKVNGDFKQYEEIFKYLSRHSGLNIHTPAEVTPLYDILRCQKELGMKLPKWTQRVFPYPLSNLSIIDWNYLAKNDELKRLSGGGIFKKIVDDTQRKINKTSEYSEKRLYIYSGHDSNIVPILEIMNIYEGQVMPYGATILLEIHKIDKKHIVKVFFQDDSEWNPQIMHIPGCEITCSLEKFIKLHEKYFGTKDMCA